MRVMLFLMSFFCMFAQGESISRPASISDALGNLRSYDHFPSPRQIARTRNKLESVYSLDRGKASYIAYHVSVASYLYDLPTELIVALIKVESNFNADAVSHANAIGFTQVQPLYWIDESPHDIYSHSENIYAGAFVLDQYRLELGHLANALRAYNIGITSYREGRGTDAANRYSKKIFRELTRIREKTSFIAQR